MQQAEHTTKTQFTLPRTQDFRGKTQDTEHRTGDKYALKLAKMYGHLHQAVNCSYIIEF